MDFDLKNIQFGVDIATSITIIGTAIMFLFNSHQQSKKEREVGINEKTRSVSLEKIQAILYEFENDFSNLVVKALKVEKPIDNHLNRGGLERLAEKIKSDADFAKSLQTNMEEFRLGVSRYYDMIQKRRYSLIPVVDSLSDKQDALSLISQDIDEIGSIHNQLGSGWHSLLSELVELKKAMIGFCIANDVLDFSDNYDQSLIQKMLADDTIKSRAISILSDADYWNWTQSFVEDEKEQIMIDAIKSREIFETEEAKSLFMHMLLNLIGGLLRGRIDMYIAQVCLHVTKDVQLARQECKDILIKLSALTHKILKNDDEIRYTDVIKIYESDEYFGRNSSIR